MWSIIIYLFELHSNFGGTTICEANSEDGSDTITAYAVDMENHWANPSMSSLKMPYNQPFPFRVNNVVTFC